MVNFGQFICKHRRVILILSLLLLIPSLIGMKATRINYDILVYLPDDIETIKGENILSNDFNMGAFSVVILDNMQTKDIIRFRANETLKENDRGVCWNKEDVLIKGQQWKAAYLPVWLYSYQEINEKKKILHYVAVNARTKEVMGSIPVHMPKLIGISLGVEIFGILLALFIDSKYNFLFLFLGVFYFLFIFLRYRNIYARHHYEVETKSCLSSLEKVDTLDRKSVV